MGQDASAGAGANASGAMDTSSINDGISEVAGGGKQHVNVTVNYRSMVENITMNGTTEKNFEELEPKFIQFFARVLNGGMYAAGQ
jgi:hypothetical protein